LRNETNSPAAAGARITEREQEAVWGLHGEIFYIAIRKFVYGTPVPSNLNQTIADHVTRFLRGTSPQLHTPLFTNRNTSGGADRPLSPAR
jgi:hypothetical protein